MLVAIPGDEEAWDASFEIFEEYQRSGGQRVETVKRAPRQFFSRPSIWVIVLLMFVYLAGSAVLALSVDRGFFLNDAFALVLFALMLGAIAFDERASVKRFFRRF